MNKSLVFIAMAALLCTGCTKKTEFGECIGAFDDGDPALNYKLSVQNAVVATILIETVVVPIVVVADQARCPVGKKAKAANPATAAVQP